MAGAWWTKVESGITVRVRVMPGARHSQVADASGETARIRIAAPAHEGKANAEVQRFLAEQFGVKRAAVSIIRGERSRDKTVLITGIASPPAAWRDRR